jgi:hypothetical protein
MGRYYETAKPTFVDDIIYKAPYELIARALQTKDLQVEQDNATIDEFDVLGEDKKYTEKDKEKRNAILNEYRAEADKIAQQIQANPQHRSAYMRQIDAAKRKFEKEISTGFLEAADRNYSLREAERKKIEARTDIGAEQKAVALAQLDHLFKGSDAEEDNVYQEGMHIYEKLDEEKFIKDKKAVITANSIKTKTNRTDGWYFTTDTGDRKFIEEDKLDDIFENSTGVGKWEKALLQRLDWQVDQGVITPEERDRTFYESRETFKQDFIKSLEFEQKDTAENILSKDGTAAQRQSLSMAWGRYNKEMDEIEDTGQVTIDRDMIPVPEENKTETDMEATAYNASAKNFKNSIRERLLASGNFTTEVPVSGDAPQTEAATAGVQTDEEALNAAVEAEYKETLDILALPLEQRRDATKSMIENGYLPSEINNLINFAENKKEVYDAAVMTSKEKKTFKEDTYSLIPPTLVGQVTLPDGTVKNMTKAEFEKTAETLIPTKKTVEKPLFVVSNGEKIAAWKSSSGNLIKIRTVDGEDVPLSEYDPNGEYEAGKKAGTEKATEVVGVQEDFDINKMSLSTTKKYKSNSPLQRKTENQKLNIHVTTSEGPMVFRINRTKEGDYTSIK